MVFIGHQEVTDVPHEGGQNPFTLDITDYVADGENELTVCVRDPTEDFVNSRGKQSFKLHDLGFDGFATDYPSVMFKVVRDLKAR